jgi:hypothetical protein
MSKGSLDSYGDPAVTWSKVSSEKMLVEPVLMGNINVSRGIPGYMRESEYKLTALSNSAVQEKDYVTDGSLKYEVLNVDEVKAFNVLDHKILWVKRMVE